MFKRFSPKYSHRAMPCITSIATFCLQACMSSGIDNKLAVKNKQVLHARESSPQSNTDVIHTDGMTTQSSLRSAEIAIQDDTSAKKAPQCGKVNTAMNVEDARQSTSPHVEKPGVKRKRNSKQEQFGNMVGLKAAIRVQPMAQDGMLSESTSLSSRLSTGPQRSEDKQATDLKESFTDSRPLIQTLPEHLGPLEDASNRHAESCINHRLICSEQITELQEPQDKMATIRVQPMAQDGMLCESTSLSSRLSTGPQRSEDKQATDLKESFTDSRPLIQTLPEHLGPLEDASNRHAESCINHRLICSEQITELQEPQDKMAAIRELIAVAQSAQPLGPEVCKVLLQFHKDRHFYVREAATSALDKIFSPIPWKANAVLYMTCLNDLLKTLKDCFKQIRNATANVQPKLYKATNRQKVETMPYVTCLNTILKTCKVSSECIRDTSANALVEFFRGASWKGDTDLYFTCLNTILEACEHSSKRIRNTSINVLSEFFKANVYEIDMTSYIECLDNILDACKSHHTNFYKAAINKLSELVRTPLWKTDATLCKKYLNVLLETLKSTHPLVRSAAERALVKLVEAAPTEASLKLLLNAVTDAHASVRSVAERALVKLVEAAPTEASLKLLLSAARDSSEYVRRAIAIAFGKLLTVAPLHTQVALEALIEAATDSSEYVCQSANQVLKDFVKATPNGANLDVLSNVARDAAWKKFFISSLRTFSVEEIRDSSVDNLPRGSKNSVGHLPKDY